jgi:acyl carrier protein phosphodiesterase
LDSTCNEMNYLAHAYLSFNDPEILVGNMISDFIKGKKKFDYPEGIQEGITLHRIIDTFTDEHASTKAAKAIFRPFYRLYSGAVVDVVYDHYLANDDTEFGESSLSNFSGSVYSVLDRYHDLLPQQFAVMFPYMKSQNWLLHYMTREGTRSSLAGLVRRAAYLSDSDTAFHLFEEHYQPLQHHYRQFWTDMKPFARTQFETLMNMRGT